MRTLTVKPFFIDRFFSSVRRLSKAVGFHRPKAVLFLCAGKLCPVWEV
jgi:hypothetical protein